MNELTPEIFVDPSDGSELLRRYNVAAVLAEVIGADWQDQFKYAADQAHPAERSLEHETCEDIGLSASKFELMTLGGSTLSNLIPGMRQLYETDFFDLMQESSPTSEMTTYSEADNDAAYELYRQLPVHSPEFLPIMEPHRDARYTAILVTEAPSDDSGVLVVHNKLQISHIAGSLVCFARGREFVHHTSPVNPGQDRVVVSINYPDICESEQDKASILNFVHGSKHTK